MWLALPVLIGCSQVRERESVLPGAHLDLLVLQVSNGLIEVVRSDTTRVDLAMRAPEGVVERSSHEQDGILTVSARCTTPVLCAIDAIAHVPADLPVRVDLGYGEVWATGIQTLNVALGEGLADIDVTGTLTAQVGHGQVRAVAAEGQVVRIAVGDGDIDIKVPRSTWAIDIVAATKSVEGVRQDGRARGSLELVAPSGRVRVRGRPSADEDSGGSIAP
jgi:hypothetical protein